MGEGVNVLTWEQKAVKVCADRGLEVVQYGFEGGWVFVKNTDGKIFPIGEDVVARWINGD